MARKLNTQFIFIGSLVVLILMAGAGGAIWYHKHHRDPKKLLAIAEQSVKDGAYDIGAAHYASAGQILHDPSLITKGGDVLFAVSYNNDDYLKGALQYWNGAIATDPRYTPALERLLNCQLEFKNLPGGGSPAAYDQIQSTAKKILANDPKNLAARIAMPMSVIDSWAHQIDNDQTKIDKAVKDLVDLQKEAPDNPEIPYYIALAYRTQGNRAQLNTQATDADAFFARADGVMDDAIKANPNNGKLYYRAAQITAGQIPPLSNDDKKLAIANRARGLAQKAAQFVKPTDPDFDGTIEMAADLTRDPESLQKYPKGDVHGSDLLMKDLTAKEKVLSEALKVKPTSIPLRIALAEMISQTYERRDEAIDLLKDLPEPTPEDRAGPRGANLRGMQLQALCTLTNMRLDKARTVRNKAEQEAMLPQIKEDFNKLHARAPDSPLVMQLDAKIKLVEGNMTDAVTILSQAVAKTDPRNTALRCNLMYLSALCYLQTGQPGSAKAYLEEILKNYPDNDEARILLAQTELNEFRTDDADANLKTLEQHIPGDIRVIRLRIVCLQQQKKTDEAKKLYSKLPEDSRNRKLDKASIALVMDQQDDAKRLLESVAAADPHDVEAALVLSEFYSHNKDTANATAAIDRALKTNPDQPQLLLTKAQLSGSSQQELNQIRMKEAEKITDPLEKELAMVSLTSDDTDQNVPLNHLKAAEKINPNDPRVMAAMFQYNISRRNWDQASAYADRLAQIDYDKVKGLYLRWQMAMARAGAEQDVSKRTAGLVKALDLATQLTHDYPDFGQTWLAVGRTNQALERYEDALPQFNAALKAQPQNAEAYRGLIECYYQLKRPDEAGKTIEQATKVLPGVPMFKELKLQYELQYGDPTKVVADREQAVKDDPSSAQALMQLAQAYAIVGNAKHSKPETEKETVGWYDKARLAFVQGAEKFPNELQFPIAHGSICIVLKKVDEGEKFWKATLSKAPWKDNPQAIDAFAEFYREAQKPDDAVKLYRDFLASPAGKNNGDIAFHLVDQLVAQGKNDDAMTVLNSLPDDAQVRLRKASLLVNEGKFADGEKLITELMQQNKTPELQADLAFIYLNSNRAPEALKLLNEALEARPGLTTALYFRAMAISKLPNPNWDDAVSDLVQVRDNAPQNLQARYLLADCLQNTRDYESAMKELEGILKMSPTQKPARIRLMNLYAAQTPPRWLDAERIAREGDSQPLLTNDVEFLAAESALYAKHNDTDRAVTYIQRALQAQPQNMSLVRTYYGVLVSGKKYQDLLSESEKLSKENKDLWWVHSYRGTAKCKLGDKDTGLQEFVAALNATLTAKDEAAGRTVVDQMSLAAGPDAALKVVTALPQASTPQWLLVAAWLQQKKGDLPASRKTVDQVLSNLDKLSSEQQQVALGFAGSIYMETPDPNFDRARDIYMQLLKLAPNDFTVYNNLACNRSVSAPEALQYAHKAYDLMQAQHVFEPLVADTYGWALIQSGDERNLDTGLNVLSEAWNSKHVVDIAYHLGAAYLKKNNAIDADRYLTQAQQLFDEAVANKDVVDITLQESIVGAQAQVAKLKNKK